MSVAACQVSTVIIDVCLWLGKLQNWLQLLYATEEGKKEQNKQKEKIHNEIKGTCEDEKWFKVLQGCYMIKVLHLYKILLKI